MNAYIKAISYFLPSKILNNSVLNDLFPEWSVDKISEKTGINQRHITEANFTSGDMAYEACNKLFKEYNILPSEIDFILLCTQSPDYFLPTTACILQDRLNIPTHAGALDFNLGCSGFVYGLGLAKGLVATGQAKNILLITAETYSKFIHPADKSNRTIFGDAAAATLISSESGFCKINDFVYGTDGSGANNLIVKEGGMRHRYKPENIETTDEYGNVHSDKHLFMNGQEIFLFTLKSVPNLIAQTLARHNLTLNEIDYFIFHQANKYMLESLQKKIKIPEDKFFIHLENCGNTVSSTIPIAIKEALAQKKFKTNQKVLLAGFGVGYSWGGCILSF